MEFRLDDESLKKDPEDVFDVLEKIGEGSYGSVLKGRHKLTDALVAIKKVPLESDLQDIVKEISIMQQCDSPFLVRYYGSYFKKSDLWIVMEYCGGGSVSDIMRLCRRALSEAQIASIIQPILKGLEYMHSRKKIHRDIKAGNILLTDRGEAKLADFGVAGQLSDTMAKRNTVIGTPFWMAPEVIQEIGYDTMADIWSLGITAIEMAEGKPPYAEFHPMRAIFMIPSKPAPTLKSPDEWSSDFQTFLQSCLVKLADKRSPAQALLKLPFIVNAKPPRETLLDVIQEAVEVMERNGRYPSEEASEDEEAESNANVGTILPGTSVSGTIVTNSNQGTVNTGTGVINNLESGTLVMKDDATLSGTAKFSDGSKNSGTSEYKPAFLAHFEQDGTPDPVQSKSEKPTAISIGLTLDELRRRLAALEPEMQAEISQLSKLYQDKRQPILDAISMKRAQQATS